MLLMMGIRCMAASSSRLHEVLCPGLDEDADHQHAAQHQQPADRVGKRVAGNELKPQASQPVADQRAGSRI